MKELAVATSILFAGVAAASAADLAPHSYTKAPVVPIVESWAGFYVGGNAGYVWGGADVTGTMLAPAPFLAVDAAAVNAAASPRLKPDGFTGGLQAGYNWQDGPAVFGLESDFDAFHLRANTGGSLAFPSTLPGGVAFPPTQFFNTTSSISTDWLFTGRGRLGWTHDHWLIYATGGVAVTSVQSNQTIAVLAPFTFNAPVSSTRVGWTVGVGAEYALTTNWSFKAEYLYLDFGTLNGVGTLTPAFAGLTYSNSTRLTANLARVGVNYKFGGPVIAKY